MRSLLVALGAFLLLMYPLVLLSSLVDVLDEPRPPAAASISLGSEGQALDDLSWGQTNPRRMRAATIRRHPAPAAPARAAGRR